MNRQKGLLTNAMIPFICYIDFFAFRYASVELPPSSESYVLQDLIDDTTYAVAVRFIRRFCGT